MALLCNYYVFPFSPFFVPQENIKRREMGQGGGRRKDKEKSRGSPSTGVGEDRLHQRWLDTRQWQAEFHDENSL